MMSHVLTIRTKNTPTSTTALHPHTHTHSHTRNPSAASSNTTASASASGSLSPPPQPSTPSLAASSTSPNSRYPLPSHAQNHSSPRTSTDADASVAAGLGPPPFAGGAYSGGSWEKSGGGATANRLETSKFILSALKEVDVYMSKPVGKGKGPEVSVPVGDAARYALGVLEIVREIAHDNVEENLALLALDTCGLVYIVMNSCRQELKRTGSISNRTKVDLGGLTTNLNAIQTFLHKHVTRSFAKRLLKHGEDTQMILVQRQKLKYWLTAFQGNEEINEDASIHDVLERLVQQQLARANTRRQSRSSTEILGTAPTVDRRDSEARPSRKKTWMVNKPLPVPDVKPKVSEDLFHLVQEKSPPRRIVEMDGRDIVDATTGARPVFHGPPMSSTILVHNENAPRKEAHLDDEELRRKERRERHKAERKAERARWLKSEREFNKLPLTSEVELELSSENADGAHTNPPSSSLGQQRQRPPPISLPRTDQKKTLRDLESERVAAELHQRTQRELVEEDEKQAKIIAAKLESEERRLKPERWSIESGGSMYAPLYPQ